MKHEQTFEGQNENAFLPATNHTATDDIQIVRKYKIAIHCLNHVDKIMCEIICLNLIGHQ